MKSKRNLLISPDIKNLRDLLIEDSEAVDQAIRDAITFISNPKSPSDLMSLDQFRGLVLSSLIEAHRIVSPVALTKDAKV